MEKIKAKVLKLYPDSQIPNKKDDTDVGYDLFVHHVEDCGEFIKVFSGIAIEPDKGYYLELLPRSSIYKKGLILYNSCGIIDNSFRGEIIGIFMKTSDWGQGIVKGSSIMQLVCKKQILCDFEEAEKLSETNRNTGGFGSTGH